MQDFFKAVKNVLKSKNIERPIFIVRSDGSYMNEAFTKIHPVETLLCGPAASAVGGAWMSRKENALIIDMGGTTTDVASVINSAPLTVEDGITINGWKTFVKGLFIDTFGLGGEYPVITERLKEMYITKAPAFKASYEGFICLKRPDSYNNFTEDEIWILSNLENGPLFIDDIAKSRSISRIDRYVKRLENEGYIIRFGITPTDMMHIKGDFCKYSKEASEYAVLCMAKSYCIDEKLIPDMVYEAVKKKLYCNIVRIMITKTVKEYNDGIPEELEKFIETTYYNKSDWIKTLFKTDLTLVGVGGPSHIFLPDVAKRLGTTAFIHENSMVANALGTLTGKISVTKKLEINYCCLNDFEGYKVFTGEKPQYFELYDDAEKAADEYLEPMVKDEIISRGGKGEITFSKDCNRNYANLKYGSFLLNGTVSVTGYANFM